ncbi:unnamed protein product [Cyclocybe aegerita]|uniref:Uncharacterized protein n=1 Tax=Cyclocybe aegerita TaxID=1973307 RepID=A0A8S0VQQ5_CYCAE|nr:unnamed protein product [Cyclocybe aegerita]
MLSPASVPTSGELGGDRWSPSAPSSAQRGTPCTSGARSAPTVPLGAIRALHSPLTGPSSTPSAPPPPPPLLIGTVRRSLSIVGFGCSSWSSVGGHWVRSSFAGLGCCSLGSVVARWARGSVVGLAGQSLGLVVTRSLVHCPLGLFECSYSPLLMLSLVLELLAVGAEQEAKGEGEG